MKRATFRRLTEGPATKLGLVALGTGTLVLLVRRQAEREDRLPPPPPPTAFALRGQRCGIVRLGGTALPRLAYEVDIPPPFKSSDLEAVVLGAQGQRLSLSAAPKNPAQAVFTRFGYADSMTSPRLVVTHKAKKVLDVPIAPLPLPVRTIPLVVAIHPLSQLNAVPSEELQRLTTSRKTSRSVYSFDYAKRPPGPVFRMMPPLRPAPGAVVSPIWNEWGSAGAFAFPASTGEHLFWIGEPGQEGSLAEMAILHPRRTTRVVETDLEIELRERDGQPGVRVTRPVRRTFPGGVSFEIPVQEQWPRPTSRSRTLRSVTLRTNEARNATMPSLFPAEAESPRGMPSVNEMGLHIAMETALEDLGLRQITLGTTTFAASAAPKGPIRYGRHRLKLRLEYWTTVTSAERHVVRIATSNPPRRSTR
jgi:hypothetical protein